MYYQDIFLKARQASRSFKNYAKIDDFLNFLANRIEMNSEKLLVANRNDLDRMSATDLKYDRLKLTARSISDIAADMRYVSTLPSPLGVVLEQWVCPNELNTSKISVPIGVVGVIYEARINVTFKMFSLCIKSGNACVLKSGNNVECSNKEAVSIIQEALKQFNIDSAMISLLPPEEEAAKKMLTANEYVDVIISHGSKELIDFVRRNAKIPVIETGSGIVHIYYDKTALREMALSIINNSKTRRINVCNSLDCLIVHKNRLNDLSIVFNPLADSRVIIYADEHAMRALRGRYPVDLLKKADENSYTTDYLDYRMAVKTVDNIEEALDHIAQYSSRHSEAIISNDPENIELFLNSVDAAVVYVNASTAFTDGAQFGLGAEIGVNAQKLHARGPMGLNELTTYKWIVRGKGQIRE